MGLQSSHLYPPYFCRDLTVTLPLFCRDEVLQNLAVTLLSFFQKPLGNLWVIFIALSVAHRKQCHERGRLSSYLFRTNICLRLFFACSQANFRRFIAASRSLY